MTSRKRNEIILEIRNFHGTNQRHIYLFLAKLRREAIA